MVRIFDAHIFYLIRHTKDEIVMHIAFYIYIAMMKLQKI